MGEGINFFFLFKDIGKIIDSAIELFKKLFG